MPPQALYTSSDISYRLGERKAGGGEGEIYFVQNHPEYLIKIYKEEKLQGKEEKIREMIPLCPNSFKNFAAPPLESLYNSRGKFVGFLMNLVDGERIHDLYWMKERQNKFPNARWNFLIRVALNLFRAANSLHKEGFIIGDINESNILVSTTDATIKLVDFDSLQFKSRQGSIFIVKSEDLNIHRPNSKILTEKFGVSPIRIISDYLSWHFNYYFLVGILFGEDQ